MKAHHDENNEYKKGLWTAEEDRVLMDYIRVHGKGKWNRIAKETGLKRCGKSCRLRWMNYLCPAIKRGDFSEEEEDLIIRLHNLLGNRWSLIAGRVPGRTDNQVKNHWNTHLSKKLGIKKVKNKEMRVNSQPLSKDQQEKDYFIPSGASLSEQPNTGNYTGDQAGIIGDKVTRDIGPKSSLEDVMMMSDNNDDNYESSFWITSADDFLINPNYSSYYDVLEPLEEQCLDFVWDIGL